MDFRPLFEEIVSWRSSRAVPSLYYEFLAPWLESNPEHIAWLRDFGHRAGSPIPSASVEDLWDLYSISRVNELLLAAFQEPASGEFNDRDRMLWVSDAKFFGDRAERWSLRLDQYTEFMRALGFATKDHASFTPILHEIVEAAQHTDPHRPITLGGEFWPALMLGDMVFSRAGVLVEAGVARASKAIAEHSAVFWAWFRRHRRAVDLSKGWGSNSQWRTEFRRDYVIGGRAYLNVDAKRDRGSDDLDEARRSELLLHRCFITSATPSPAEDLWPYNRTAIVSFP